MTTPSGLRIVHAQAVAAGRWRNGGGWTRELLALPAPARAGGLPWQLRISLADVAHGGPFSRFPGVERWFAVVEGSGVLLRIAGREHRLEVASMPLRFDGALAVDCELLDGATRDLNLMAAAGRAELLPAASGRAWSAAPAMRGLFTRVAGHWSDGRGTALALPAQTLLWATDAPGAAWTFAPQPQPPAGAPAPPGWWLAYDPG